MTTHRTTAAAALLAVSTTLAAQAAEPEERRMQLYTATCAHFHDRLAAVDDRGRLPLLARLSRVCDRALARLERPAPDRAAAYLDRLAAYKATLVTMTLDRMFDPAVPAGAVTATGEYLIARRMGVLPPMANWEDDGDFWADFPVADGE